MSKIYKNFGVTTTHEKRRKVPRYIHISGEKINYNDIDILNRRAIKNPDTRFGGKTHLREKVFADFQSSGYTEKQSNFYADTFI